MHGIRSRTNQEKQAERGTGFAPEEEPIPRLTRRRLLAGTGATVIAAALAQFPGARLIQAQGATYDLIDLWTATESLQVGGFTVAGGGNALGGNNVAVGYAVANGKSSPAVWSEPGRPTLLKSGKHGGTAVAINRDGVVVGGEFNADFTPARAVLWRGDEKINLGPPNGIEGKITSGSASGINDNGVAIGSLVANERRLGVRWEGDEAHELAGVEGGVANPMAINNDGVVVGTVQVSFEDGQTSGSTAELAVWEGTDATIIERPEDVARTDPLMLVADVNGGGQVLVQFGSAEDTDKVSSYLMEIEGGNARLLPGLSEEHTYVRAAALNDAGAAVGISREPDADVSPVLWLDGEVHDLRTLVPSDSGIELYNAVDITNDNVILSHGRDADDVLHVVLLVPAS